MNVLFVASECAPFVKTGGLADVVGAIPKAVAPLGVAVRVLLPAYPALAGLKQSASEILTFDNLFGGTVRVLQTSASGVDLLLVDAPHLYERPGNIYVDEKQIDWPDNHLRFGALAWLGAYIALRGIVDWKPDLVHCHDWQAALVPAYLKQDSMASSHPLPPTIMTVHNIAFQGLFDNKVLGELGLSDSLYNMHGVEYYQQVGFLKGGLALADKITTVSPTYARELLTAEFGMGLEGLLQSREADLKGILNGIDIDVWNPATDSLLPATYSKDNLSAKAKNRANLLHRFELQPNDHAPLFCVVSRLSEQKGLDLLLQSLPALVSSGARLALLGTGDPLLEQAFVTAAERYRGSVGVEIGYDEKLAHIMQGGSDAILIPSRFEPCGLTQLYGLRYGTLPVVAKTGGLADTVIDANAASVSAGCATGFVFSPINAQELENAIRRCCELYQNHPAWQKMVHHAMQQTVSWDQSAQLYCDLYKDLLSTP